MLVFALVMIFIFQAGAMMVAQVAATNAAREGARAAAALPPGDPITAASRSLPPFEREISVGGEGESVTVYVRVKTPVLFSAVKDWNWWAQSSATMRREQ